MSFGVISYQLASLRGAARLLLSVSPLINRVAGITKKKRKFFSTYKRI